MVINGLMLELKEKMIDEYFKNFSFTKHMLVIFHTPCMRPQIFNYKGVINSFLLRNHKGLIIDYWDEKTTKKIFKKEYE